MKELRAEDPSLWSIVTLARLFNVKRIAIRFEDQYLRIQHVIMMYYNSKVAPADKEHQAYLDKEKAILASIKPYKRKVYLAQRQMVRS